MYLELQGEARWPWKDKQHGVVAVLVARASSCMLQLN